MNNRPVLATVIGGGPAGLMAAEQLTQAGYLVDLYDAMPSVGRKFLLAGIGGLNITHAEPFSEFSHRYAERTTQLQAYLEAFNPSALRAWCANLGIETFVGSSGRVFPKDMKAAPLLRAWLHRLRASGVQFSMRHRWVGWAESGELKFDSPAGQVLVQADAVVLALGGGSWSRAAVSLGAAGVSMGAAGAAACDAAVCSVSDIAFLIRD